MTTKYVSCPYRDLPLSGRATDTIETTARSSRTARMTVFMMIVLLSGQQTECCGGSLRRYLYRELLWGRGEWELWHFFFWVGKTSFCDWNKDHAWNMFCSQGLNCRWTNVLIYFHKCGLDRNLVCVTVCASNLLLMIQGCVAENSSYSCPPYIITS
jgi:hypothetical protein